MLSLVVVIKLFYAAIHIYLEVLKILIETIVLFLPKKK